jgi:GntR family transcriptional regulator
MIEQNIPVVTKVLRLEVVEAHFVAERELRISQGEPIIVLDRLRLILDEPILVVTSYLPYNSYSTLVNEDLENNSLYYLLRTKYKTTPSKAIRHMEAVPASHKEAELLDISPGAPLMLIESTTFCKEHDVPFEYFKARHRGDRTRFIVESYMAEVKT